jgi:hypothetical protein
LAPTLLGASVPRFGGNCVGVDDEFVAYEVQEFEHDWNVDNEMKLLVDVMR